MIEISFLELHFSQLVRAWKIARYNTYSDAQKQDYHSNLQTLYAGLKDLSFDKLPETERLEVKEIIDFFIQSLDFLNNSTINNAPYELVECLKYAMKDWADNPNDFIIVTSYNDYSFDPTLVILSTYTIIEAKFGIKFNRKLVQINLPKFLERDYLCNAILYHELGHFIDQVQNVYLPIAIQVWDNRTHPDCWTYFPYLENPDVKLEEVEYALCSHVKEYFADLFASQYIKEAAGHYLSYIAGNDIMSRTHPATSNRIKLITEFLGSPTDYGFVLHSYLAEIQKQTGKEFKIRCKEIVPSDILNLIPCEIEEKDQLHSLYSESWDIWMKKRQLFQSENNMTTPLKPSQVYQIINNLIEKSINNFIVSEKWKKSLTSGLI